MSNRIATQTACLALAAVFTALTLGGVDSLAQRESTNAQSPELVAVQQVVVTGRRLPGS